MAARQESMVVKYLAWLLMPALLSLGVSFACGARLRHEGGASRFEEGRILFELRCSGCHTVDGSGQRRLGPPLDQIGKTGAERKPGMTSLDYILESILDPGAFRSPGAAGAMPQGIMNVHSSEELRQLVGFLGSQGAEVQEAELGALKVPENWRREAIASKLDVDKVDRGEAIFRGKGQCIACHPLRPEPALTLRGPSLLDIGTLSA